MCKTFALHAAAPNFIPGTICDSPTSAQEWSLHTSGPSTSQMWPPDHVINLEFFPVDFALLYIQQCLIHLEGWILPYFLRIWGSVMQGSINTYWVTFRYPSILEVIKAVGYYLSFPSLEDCLGTSMDLHGMPGFSVSVCFHFSWLYYGDKGYTHGAHTCVQGLFLTLDSRTTPCRAWG